MTMLKTRCLDYKINPFFEQNDEELYFCEICDYCNYFDGWEYDFERNELICPNCGSRIAVDV